MIGSILGGYEIVEEIGQGRTTVVYKAWDGSTDRYVALKVLPHDMLNDRESVERFAEEARVIARLEHIHILPLHEAKVDQGLPLLVMRYMPGGTLADWVAEGRMKASDVAKVMGQVAAALDYAHERAVLHRDIKPQNILLDKHRNAYVSDFGLAKPADRSKDLTGNRAVGTPETMSPEQAMGYSLTPASDQYGLGVLLFYMLSDGRYPFMHTNRIEVMRQHVQDEPLPIRYYRSDLSEDAEEVLLRALDKKPHKRFPSCSAFAGAFAQVIEKRGISWLDSKFISGDVRDRIERALRELDDENDA